MEKLSVGRIVHVQTDTVSSGKCRPTIVVAMIAPDHGLFNGVMFLDGRNDDPVAGHLNRWVTSVPHRDSSERREQFIDWHWHTECPE